MGRSDDSAGLDYWTETLKNGTKAGADVAKGFILIEEFINQKRDNASYVNVLYSAFFDRQPDQGGYSHWLGRLNSGISREEALNGFISSQEFFDYVNPIPSRQRTDSFITHSRVRNGPAFYSNIQSIKLYEPKMASKFISPY